MKVPSRPVSFLGLSLATALTLLSFSLTLSSSSTSSSISGVYALPVRSSQPLHSLSQSSSQQQLPSRKQHTQVRRRSKDTPAPSSHNSNKKRKDPSSAQSKTQRQKQKKKSPSTSNSNSNSNSASARRQQQKQKKQSLVKALAAAAEQYQERGPAPGHPRSQPPQPPRSSPTLLSKKSTSPASLPSSTSTTSFPEFDKPLLIVPPPRSVWHAGSVQLVKWSKTYARQLPKDTTVDIILADAKTNKKIVSLKRFIPFRKGSAQVWVPSKIPDNEDASASYVLVLDLFHGKSQKPITVDSVKASAAAATATLAASSSSSLENNNKPASTSGTLTTESSGARGEAGAAAAVLEAITAGTGASTSSKKSVPSILRRSDINIYKRAIPSLPSSSSSGTTSTSATTSSSIRENHRIAAVASPAGARADVSPSQPYTAHQHNDDFPNDDDTIDSSQAAGAVGAYYDFDNYFRQEFPNVIQPIELEHSFGVHQKVYSRAPYTLEWKIPTRAAELLEYTATRLRLLANKDIDWSQHQSIRDNNIAYQAKLFVELVRDGGPGPGSIESVAVLARNVPAETKFQYLQIYDHVEPAFYRLRVQMLVVEVDDTPAGRRSRKTRDVMDNGNENEDPMLDGWDFARGAKIIDRYESITRKFWVSAGAL
ncbi:hypothetical protein BG015_008226 [Linnemannia schmuckeri]|uniref:Uncharacterized protein n=1 Tax=Linnemannia schmuckeri TaxID=64567 RepID=A0A9P5S879_9FUNG|nr:hypothetical protein BG015_008226 [Linnemannia schmuckeri]